MKINYTNLSFTQLIDKIEANRFFDLPRMVREAFRRLLTRVEALEAPKYKVYTALLTQSGTDAPIATVLENTLGGDVVWSYVDVGNYIGETQTDVFIQNKTFFNITLGESLSDSLETGLSRINNSAINLLSYGIFEGVISSVELESNNISIEIRVYN